MKYNWQQQNWPNFTYNSSELESIVQKYQQLAEGSNDALGKLKDILTQAYCMEAITLLLQCLCSQQPWSLELTSITKNIEFYSQNSDLLFSKYQSISFKNVHNSQIQAIEFQQCKTALVIGAGSGRYALALKHKKLCVTAIEPSDDLRALGKTFTGDDVTWLNDSLPQLEKVKGKTFDIILISAVRMHLSPQEQTQSLKTI